MSGLGIGPILTRPSNWVQGVPEWPLPGSEMVFFGHGGLWRSPAYLHTRPPKWAAFGSALEAHFLAAWQRAWGGYHPLWLGLSEKFHLPKKIFFLLRLGWYVAAAGLRLAFSQPSISTCPAPSELTLPGGFAASKGPLGGPGKCGGRPLCVL